jgi:probable addiction module antidote protein
VKWEDGLMKDLQDPEFALGYLEACLEEGVPLEVALGDVVRAQGVGKVARRARLDRPNLIRALRPNANPTLGTFRRMLHGVGMELAARPLKTAKLQHGQSKKPLIAGR